MTELDRSQLELRTLVVLDIVTCFSGLGGVGAHDVVVHDG